MSTAAPKPATTPIPVQLSAPEFEVFILPHRSMPKRGLKCKLGYCRVFNLILWVLYTLTVSPLLTPVAPRSALLYQSLPASIPYRHAIPKRRKDDTHVGPAARSIVA